MRTSRSPRWSAATPNAASTGGTPCVHELLAIVAEFGAAALDEPRTVLAFYEAMRASDGITR